MCVHDSLNESVENRPKDVKRTEKSYFSQLIEQNVTTPINREVEYNIGKINNKEGKTIHYTKVTDTRKARIGSI